MAPDETVATYDYQTTTFTVSTRGLLLINYDAWNTSPYLFITGSTMNPFSTAPVTSTITYPSGTEPVPIVAYDTGLTEA